LQMLKSCRVNEKWKPWQEGCSGFWKEKMLPEYTSTVKGRHCYKGRQETHGTVYRVRSINILKTLDFQSKKTSKFPHLFSKKYLHIKINWYILQKLANRRRSGKLLSYQVISTENCPCQTGAKGFADFCFVPSFRKRTEACMKQAADE
jgi:hypothetical protein